MRPEAQARETSEVGRGRQEEKLPVVRIWGVPLRTATGATRGTCHRPVTPELGKERKRESTASVCAPGTAGFPALPPSPQMWDTGKELALGG